MATEEEVAIGVVEVNERFAIVLLSSGPILWMLGGTFLKVFRRVVWPLECFVILCIDNKDKKRWGMYALSSVIMFLVNSLGYGDGTPRWAVVPVFLSYVLPAAVINKNAAAIMALPTVIALVLLMQLSLQHNDFAWKIWEATAGLLQASSIYVARNFERRR